MVVNHWHGTAMTTPRIDLVPVPPADARSLLAPFIGSVAAAMVLAQLVVALTGGSGLVAGLLTAVVALGVAVWGVGLLLHLTGAILGRGWEDLR